MDEIDLQLVGLAHHQVEIAIVVDRCADAAVVVHEFVFGDLQ